MRGLVWFTQSLKAQRVSLGLASTHRWMAAPSTARGHRGLALDCSWWHPEYRYHGCLAAPSINPELCKSSLCDAFSSLSHPKPLHVLRRLLQGSSPSVCSNRKGRRLFRELRVLATVVPALLVPPTVPTLLLGGRVYASTFTSPGRNT